jgi:hypothetical protein
MLFWTVTSTLATIWRAFRSFTPADLRAILAVIGLWLATVPDITKVIGVAAFRIAELIVAIALASLFIGHVIHLISLWLGA